MQTVHLPRLRFIPSSNMESLYVNSHEATQSGSGAGEPAALRVAEVVTALSQALDLGSGSTAWHSVRTCILGMRIAAEMKVPPAVQEDLYYALLLKDVGLSGEGGQISDTLGFRANDREIAGWAAPGQQFKREAPDYCAARGERGTGLARLMGLTEATAAGIGSVAEHWDGSGDPNKLAGRQIPLIGRIVQVAQNLDVLVTSGGAAAALQAVSEKTGSWFDPEVSSAALSLAKAGMLWSNLNGENLPELAKLLEPKQKMMADGAVTLEAICRAFASIVDAKSPFTYRHSIGVANVAVAIANKLSLPPSRTLMLWHAALLHDLGKMAVSNAILQKPGALNTAEWREIHSHPEYTWRILKGIRGFEEISEIAASHHERLDGSGYFRGLSAAQLSIEARILAVADIFEALSTRRPYRDALPLEQVFAIIRKGTPHEFDERCVDALEQCSAPGDQHSHDLQTLQQQLGNTTPVGSEETDKSGLPSDSGHSSARRS